MGKRRDLFQVTLSSRAYHGEESRQQESEVSNGGESSECLLLLLRLLPLSASIVQDLQSKAWSPPQLRWIDLPTSTNIIKHAQSLISLVTLDSARMTVVTITQPTDDSWYVGTLLVSVKTKSMHYTISQCITAHFQIIGVYYCSYI